MPRRAKLLILAGIVLIAVSLGGLLFTRVMQQKTQADTAALLERLDGVLPQSSTGLPGTYRVTAMPVLQILEQDIVAVLSIPEYGLRLPVRDQWTGGRAWGIPRRFAGSAYDGTLIIGGSDQPGQFDCFDRIPHDTRLILTDMAGGEFTYRVDRIQRSGSADAHILLDPAADLTLFVRDTMTMEYLILRCTHE